MRFYSDNFSTLNFAGSGYTDGTILYVGAATGAIYASATATTPISGRNISSGISPVIDSNHEYSATSGSKWAVGAYSGTAVAAANIGTGGVLTVPRTGGAVHDGRLLPDREPRGASAFPSRTTSRTSPTTPPTPSGAARRRATARRLATP